LTLVSDYRATPFLPPEWSDDKLNPDGTSNTTNLRLAGYAGIGFGQGEFQLFQTAER